MRGVGQRLRWLSARRLIGLAALTVLAELASGRGANAQPAKKKSYASVELIAQEAAQAGRIRVGLLFHMDPGWHIYWENPGDSGTAPTINWSVPAGFRVGAIRWPQPVRLGGGSVIDYGYEKQVLLMAPLERASAQREPVRVSLAADVKYVVCQQICVPGKAHVTLSLPAGGRASADASRWNAIFERTLANLPKAAPATWKISATSVTVDRQRHFLISVETGSRVGSAAFFPLDPDVVENSARQAFGTTSKGFQLTLQPSDLLSKPISTLRGLIVLGPQKAYEVDAPMAVVAR